MLMSDGSETASPWISDVLPMLQNKMVTVNTIAIGPKADPQLESLSLERGGTSYFATDDPVQMAGDVTLSVFESTSTHLALSDSPIIVSRDPKRTVFKRLTEHDI